VISLERIEEARSVIDPVFLDTPQFRSDALSEGLGADVVLKVECLNPVRSFKLLLIGGGNADERDVKRYLCGG
jgi:threonine dehydratase